MESPRQAGWLLAFWLSAAGVAAAPPSAGGYPARGGVFSAECPDREGFYYILWRGRDLASMDRPVAMRIGQGEAEARLSDTVPMRGQGFFRIEEIRGSEFRDVDGDGVSDLYELEHPEAYHPLNPAEVLDSGDGAVWLPDRAAYEFLSRRDNVPGVQDIREVKFLVTDLDSAHPRFHFINTRRHPYHYYFAILGLGLDMSLVEFNAQTYSFNDGDRKFLAGSLLAHDHYVGPDGREGLYTVEFWPTDPVPFASVERAFETISATMPFAGGRLAYHPAGETQERKWREEEELFRRSHVRTITTSELFGNVGYAALNPGSAFGRLRVVEDGSDLISSRDIVILTYLPNDLSHVAGILSEAPQTPLSHVNLKARQNGTPNAYVPSASSDPRIAPLIGRNVYYEVNADGFVLREATYEEVEAYYEAVRPAETSYARSDLTVEEIAPLAAIGFGDGDVYGAKASNLAELRRAAAAAAVSNPGAAFDVPDGFAVPFAYYAAFLRHNHYDDEVQALLAREDFRRDVDVRDAELAELRRRIRKEGHLPNWMRERIGWLQGQFPPGQGIRCRSSTNNEDLPGFNGAGLYDSFTHHPDEGHLEKTVRQVWASMWNLRAFEEREFHRIDHLSAAMAVLAHPNYEGELANGVGVTRNLVDPNWLGYYVNAQVGEDLVTNPEEASVPDEFLVSLLVSSPDYSRYDYEVQYVRQSNRRVNGMPVLQDEEIDHLADAMQVVQNHFKPLYRGGRDFAMEIEFKIDAGGRLVIKQARPWLE